MGYGIGRSFKYNRSKISTPTLKKPVLYSSAANTSYTSNLTRTFISSQLENEDSTVLALASRKSLRFVDRHTFLHVDISF